MGPNGFAFEPAGSEGTDTADLRGSITERSRNAVHLESLIVKGTLLSLQVERLATGDIGENLEAADKTFQEERQASRLETLDNNERVAMRVGALTRSPAGRLVSEVSRSNTTVEFNSLLDASFELSCHLLENEDEIRGGEIDGGTRECEAHRFAISFTSRCSGVPIGEVVLVSVPGIEGSKKRTKENLVEFSGQSNRAGVQIVGDTLLQEVDEASDFKSLGHAGAKESGETV